LLIQAARELRLDLARSYFVGDSLDDVIAGQKVGCTTLLVRTGRGKEESRHLGDFKGDQPALVDDLLDAANWILAREATAIRAMPIPQGHRT
jgi:D-glycero-D-manno-heptose 1,7-bisphosphate phosphatase